MYKRSALFLASLGSMILFHGCGSSSDSATDTTTATSAQVIDSYIENLDYSCADGSSGITDSNGSFDCQELPVTFKVGELELGSLSQIPADRQVFPQDILGVARDDLNNTKVVAMAQFLQSCDEDNDTQNGITIANEIKNSFLSPLSFNENDIDAYAQEANITLIDPTSALEHLTQSVSFIESVDAASFLPLDLKEALYSSAALLSQEAKDTLSYMGNEERLAHDLYLNLYQYILDNFDTTLPQLLNIGLYSETTHIESVQLLVKKYITTADEFSNVDLVELNYKESSVDAMESGTYDISAIQNLYDELLQKGMNSPQDALEVGCMVEVTDINDLDEDIATAQASNADDIVAVFEFLRDGSYNHYWSFDNALKLMGVTQGCCSLGESYCHPEYPR